MMLSIAKGRKKLCKETDRLYEKLQHVGWTRQDCAIYAPMTLDINTLKKKKNAIILAHSYQSPDIVYGVADFVGDSYGLSEIAAKHPASMIVFCSVYFMAETAKILSPEKTVLVPSRAGCSLADSITAKDVEGLRQSRCEKCGPKRSKGELREPDRSEGRRHSNFEKIAVKGEHFPSPGRCEKCPPVVCYINTSAEVKAASDICCTSSNVLKIIEALPEQKIIFIPDKYMADYIRRSTKKTIYDWPGRCIVHEQFSSAQIKAVREQHPGVKILVHPECTASVIDQADFVGSTSAIIDYIKHCVIPTDSSVVVEREEWRNPLHLKKRDSSTPACPERAKRVEWARNDRSQAPFMIVSECGLADRIRAENPSKTVVGTCSLCPYMKQIQLKDVLTALKSPRSDQIVEIPEETLKKAKKSLERMFEITDS